MDRTWTRTPPRGCVRPSVCPPSDFTERLDITSNGPPKMFRALSIHRDGSPRAGAVGVELRRLNPLAKTNHPEMTRSLQPPPAGIRDMPGWPE
jgi:hypothetical protein